jgi:hypothetical protein
VNRGLSIIDRILLAAADLARKAETFTAEDLVVRAWEMYPEHFGLQKYADKHPDSNRILTKIMGSGGLRGKGWLTKVGAKRYRVTDVGLLAADRLREVTAPLEGTEKGRLAQIERQFVFVLQRMLRSVAFEKYRAGQVLTFSDVCAFWNISPRSTANQLTRRTTQTDTAIALALKQLESGGKEAVVLPGTQDPVEARDLQRLRALSDDIRVQFSKEISVILGRTDERYY